VIITSESIEVFFLLPSMEGVDADIPVVDLKSTILRVPNHERSRTDLLDLVKVCDDHLFSVTISRLEVSTIFFANHHLGRTTHHSHEKPAPCNRRSLQLL
jgi:hypothetical protein